MDKGYSLIKGIFDEEEITDIRNEMEIIFEGLSQKAICGNADPFLMKMFKKDPDAFVNCAHMCQKLCSVYSLAGCLFNTLLELGLQFPVLNTKPLVSFSSKHTAKNESYWKLGAHQDWPSNLGSTNGITCWVPLQDVDDDLGPLEVIPNSHLLGPLNHSGLPPVIEDDSLESEFSPIPMKVGDALFFHTMLIHRSGENKTDNRIRWSMHFRYNDASEQSFIDRKYPRNRTND